MMSFPDLLGFFALAVVSGPESAGVGAAATLEGGLKELFTQSPSLTVPLGEVILLVIVVNAFALFRKARLIMVASYLFCLKWVFWSNYSELFKHSDALAMTSTSIFVICGISTVIFFCMDRFGEGS